MLLWLLRASISDKITIQLAKKKMYPPINKPYVNEVTLTEHLLVLLIEFVFVNEVEIFLRRFCGSL